MVEVVNAAKAKLQAGELALGVGLRQARTVDTAKVMKTCGFDWLFIDMEHSAMSVDNVAQMSVAAQDAGVTPIVRVPGFQHFHATRVLDGGAQGIVVPHVDNAGSGRADGVQLPLSPSGPSLGYGFIAPDRFPGNSYW